MLDEGARYVSFSWGIDGGLIGRARERGAVVLVQVGDVASAVEAAERGAEVVIAQGVEAGGHVQGTRPLVELLRELRSALELPIVAAGGIGNGSGARVALAAGADAVAYGTAFLAAHEADVHPIYVDRLVHAAESDTCSPPSSTSVGRMRRTAFSRNDTSPPGNWPVVAHAGTRRAKARSSPPATDRRSCATATRSQQGARLERSTQWRCTRVRLSVTSTSGRAPKRSPRRSPVLSRSASSSRVKRHSPTLVLCDPPMCQRSGASDPLSQSLSLIPARPRSVCAG